jgi:hypothetical protein
MVEQIRISPEEVRGYGNICEEHTLEDFIISNSGLAKEKETVHGALTNVYKLVYSLYGLIFSFDKGNKQLYLHSDNDAVVGFSFSENSLVFNTVSHISFAFADKNLIVDDEHYLFIDKGTSASHNDNWEKSSNVTLVRNEKYTTVSNSSSSSALYKPDNWTLYSGDIAIEWDNWATTYKLNYFIVTGASDLAKTFGTLYINKPCHVKITIIGTTCKCYIDGVEKYSYTINRDSNDKVKVRLQINSGGDNIKYSNFRIYSID